MLPRTKEFELLVVRVPSHLKRLVHQAVRMDTHTNLSEYVRDAIRQKLYADGFSLIHEAESNPIEERKQAVNFHP